jgi:hypothetical protein
MKAPTLTCENEQRRDAVRDAKGLFGLDYLEVLSEDQTTLRVCFLGKAPAQIGAANLRIKGGRRIRDIQVTGLRIQRQADPTLDDCMEITVNKPGDFSTYTLSVVELDKEGHATGQPRSDFDPRYAHLDFSFKAGCPSDLDCKLEAVCPPPERVEPEINYLAKDYASFRQLILDRLALIMPDWQERHVPDLGIALVEVLAYAGDYLSYYQDAVATEAYLATARERISVCRHVRLVDYPMHEGCNARAWICVSTGTNLSLDPAETYFITGYPGAPQSRILKPEDLQNVPSGQYEVFEPLVENRDKPIQLYAAHSKIYFYTWGDRECCLPRGATSATLIDEWVPTAAPPTAAPGSREGPMSPRDATAPPAPTAAIPPAPGRALQLQVGDVLIFEEVIGPKTGNPADADPTHRHAVRLTRVETKVDKLYNPPDGQPIVDIEWAEEDALPFPLCISAIGPPRECRDLENISVACGNVILVDNGGTTGEMLGTVPTESTTERCPTECQPTEVEIVPGQFRPSLRRKPLTFRQPLPANGAASTVLREDPRRALPWIELSGTQATPVGDVVTTWTAQRDLLSSQSKDQHFVVEIDNDGYAHVRFGDGDLGRMPEAATVFQATYRVGNGPAGNVGAEAISYLVLRHTTLSGVSLIPRNPLPAQGGKPPEPLAEIKLLAPHAFRTELQRAITADDYARLAERNPKVQRAGATLRWTGSWYEVLVAIDPLGTEEAVPALLQEIIGYLYRYRRMGHNLVVAPAHYVSLDIAMTVCVLPHYLRGHVEAALLDVFSNRLLPDGRRGFFHPDNLTFCEGIYLSKLVAAAQAVPGVESVTVTKLQRFSEKPNDEIKKGILPLGPLEVARLDNDPSFPENGKFVLDVRGGR